MQDPPANAGGTAPHPAEPGTGGGSEPGKKPGGSSVDSGGGEKLATLERENGELKTLVGDLRKQIKGLSKERDEHKSSARTVEERLAEVEGKLTAAEQKAAAATRKQLETDAIDKALLKIPEQHRKYAKGILRGYVPGVDFAAEESDPVQALTDKLAEEFPEIVEPPKERVNLPRQPKVQNGQNSEPQQVGIVKDGVQLL